MTTTLYANSVSTNSLRTMLTAAHLGISYQLVRIDLGNPADQAKVAELNPNRKIPVMVDGDLVLWESHAISTYWCDITPGQTLLPHEPRAKAEVNRWLYWISAHLSQPCGGLNFERFIRRYKGLGEPDAKAVAAHEASFHQFAKVADAHLASRTWLANDALSLADYSLTATLNHAEAAQYPLAAYTHLVAHRARVRELPAWAKVFS